jgi:uncharacterized protein YjdB
MPKRANFSPGSSFQLLMAFLVMAIGSMLPGCGSSSSNSLNGITVTPPGGSVGIDARLQFKATGTYQNGSTQDLTASATWSSSSTSVATITSPGGLATGVALGTSEITATSGSVSSGPVELNVIIIPTLVSITVAPVDPSVGVAATVQFMAMGLYDDGSMQNLTSSATWSSTSTNVATITSPGGLATGVAAGTTTITATSGTVSGNTNLTVN